MKINRIDHVGIVVNDLAAAKEFFLAFGLEMVGEAELEGEWLDKVIGLDGVRDAITLMRTPDGEAMIELIQYYSPTDENGVQRSLSNTLGIRHICFAVQDIEALVAKMKKKGMEVFSEIYNYKNTYKDCFCRGPEGIILELAEKIN